MAQRDCLPGEAVVASVTFEDAIGELSIAVRAWQDCWDAYHKAVCDRRTPDISGVVPFKVKLTEARALVDQKVEQAVRHGWRPPAAHVESYSDG